MAPGVLHPVCRVPLSPGTGPPPNMVLINAHSVVNKTFLLNDLFSSQNLDFMFITESLFSHLVILQTLLSKATFNWGKHKAIHLEEAIRQRKCS